jgi:fructokinase
MIRIGVDFGGTKIEAAALDDEGRFQARVRAPNPRDYPASLQVVCELVDEAERQAGARGHDRRRHARLDFAAYRPYPQRQQHLAQRAPFREDLSAALGREIRAGQRRQLPGPFRSGGWRGRRLARGVRSHPRHRLRRRRGGAMGETDRGRNGVAGEWGHMPLPWPKARSFGSAPSCWCGRTGCLELYLSGTGLEADFARAGGGGANAQAIVAAPAPASLSPKAAGRYTDRLARAWPSSAT